MPEQRDPANGKGGQLEHDRPGMTCSDGEVMGERDPGIGAHQAVARSGMVRAVAEAR
jgi:hypothetical protein